MRTKYAFFVMAILLLSAPSFAFIVTVPDETINVAIGSSRQIDIRVDSGIPEDIQFTILDPKPWITQDTTRIRLNGDETKDLRIFVTPSADTQPSVYRISLLAESLISGETQKKFIFININKLDIVDVERVIISGNFTPTSQIVILTTIKNYKARTVQNIRVTSSISAPSSKLIEFEQNIDSLDSGETKNFTYTFTLPPRSESGLYTILTMVSAEGETSEKTRTFTVLSQAQFAKESKKEPLVFGYKKSTTVTNIGNSEDDALLTETLSGLDAAFYSGEQPTTMKGSEFAWLLKDIKPGESRTMAFRVDYSPLFLFIIVILIAGWVFFFKVRIIKVKKFILEKKFIEEGEEFTVGVEIANSTGKKVENATVKDFVPSVFEIKEGEGPKPARKKTAAGTELVWKIKDIHKNEERILSYKIMPVFGVHGRIRLPQASVSFHRGKKEMEIRSPYTSIGIETENYGEKKGVLKRKK
ncbi:MAG: hypothetical protein J4400_01385 [Candidatus Aenigmarchaeota archaeon]|nr:hypothetical protein [Candidatus Aenigmarchaeota archaeon]